MVPKRMMPFKKNILSMRNIWAVEIANIGFTLSVRGTTSILKKILMKIEFKCPKHTTKKEKMSRDLQLIEEPSASISQTIKTVIPTAPSMEQYESHESKQPPKRRKLKAAKIKEPTTSSLEQSERRSIETGMGARSSTRIALRKSIN
uniref:Uncharacterized protein n=1 Tax=Clytia hemisphaerica TaxID=252671 RepID=A0A7M5XKW4_9CNID